MLESTAENLCNILEEEYAVYRDINEISKKKKEIIIKGDLEDLEKIVKMEQSLVVKAGKLEERREAAALELAEQQGIEREEINITNIADVLGGEYAKRLQNKRDKISDVMKSLKQTNDLNSKLIKNSLEYIDFSINIMSALDVDNNNYKNSGEAQDGSNKNFFDVKL